MAEGVTEGEAKAIGARHIYTNWLIDRFRKAIDDGQEVVTWQELSEVIGEPATSHRGKVDTARDVILTEYKIRFQSVPGVGYRRASDLDVLGEVSSQRKAIARRSTRALKLMYHASDPSKLSRDDQTRYVVEQSILLIAKKAATEKTHQSLASRVKAPGVKLSLEESLEALR